MSINPMINQRSDETYKEAVQMLRDTGKCAILRPTGFGKTMIMCRVSRRYKKILYVYPTEIVKKHVIGIINGLKAKDGIQNSITFCTYTYLGKLHENAAQFCEKLVNDGYDLIIFDEIHHMGAFLVKKTLDILSNIDVMKINILGGTATPDRMDGYDVIGNYFGNSLVSFYGIDNLIEDGLIPEPYYVYSTYGIKWVTEYLNGIQQKLKSTNVIVDLRKKKTQIAYMLNAPVIIKDAVNKVYQGVPPQYMRFMVFFSTKQILSAKSSEVIQWFKTAFPNYTVNEPLIIHSGNVEKQNVHKLAGLGTDPNTIDLIFSINMLNEGYHAGNITGCLLLRPTQSQIVYTQQVGRCLQVGMNNRPIILDFVENLHTHALYGVNTRQEIKTTDNKLENDIVRLNTINKDHIEIRNIVEEVEKVLNRLSGVVAQQGVTDEILKYRKIHTATAADIAVVLNIPLYQVMTVLHMHRNELEPLGLQLQTADRFEGYNTKKDRKGNCTGIRVDKFDEYMKQLG